MEPLIAVVTPAAEDGVSGGDVRGWAYSPHPNLPGVRPSHLSPAHIMKQLMSGFRQMQ